MFDKLVRYLVERAGKEYSAKYRTVATILGAALFLAGWPFLVGFIGGLFPGAVFSDAAINVISMALFVLGVPWLVWAVVWQLWKGQGTPVPAVPTKKFLQSGPYRYCRHPMMLGFFLYLAGWAVRFNQAGACLGALVLLALLVAEIKLIEEKELEARFGDAYRQYKKETPFFIPKLK
ncbi:MAG TPA: isoprenylcysteine carboxylmethyltransferase family protein [Candidatus Omnitrophota bacterium]|nr:isoprenylcysteine carboxylmethyltransferase family protein [Candidatus Omnitrophota bacterium]HPS37062.1 isoprenylcysteine carboxylmethyltransferase family protein [Candidatus Omnitrophota bacterium]